MQLRMTVWTYLKLQLQLSYLLAFWNAEEVDFQVTDVIELLKQ